MANEQAQAAATGTAPQEQEGQPQQTEAPPPLLRTREGVQLHDVDALWRYATWAQASSLNPDKSVTVHDIAMKIEVGAAVGLPPIVAIQKIYIVKGQATVWGDVLLGICMRSGRFDFSKFREWFTGNPGDDDYTAHCIVSRIGVAEPVHSEYSIADAKTAKLWGKKTSGGKDTTWITHWKRMLKYRSRAFGLRDAFADVLSGLYDRDEMLDVDKTLDALDLTGTTVMPEPTEGQTADQVLTEQLSKPEPAGVARDYKPDWLQDQPVDTAPRHIAEQDRPPDRDRQAARQEQAGNTSTQEAAPAPASEPELNPNEPIGSRSNLYKLLRFDFDGLTQPQKNVFREAVRINLITDLAKWRPEPAAKAHETLRGMLVERGKENTK
jgi:hypothetical protein